MRRWIPSRPGHPHHADEPASSHLLDLLCALVLGPQGSISNAPVAPRLVWCPLAGKEPSDQTFTRSGNKTLVRSAGLADDK